MWCTFVGPKDTLFDLDGSYPAGTFFELSDRPVTLHFTSDDSVTYQAMKVV